MCHHCVVLYLKLIIKKGKRNDLARDIASTACTHLLRAGEELDSENGPGLFCSCRSPR